MMNALCGLQRTAVSCLFYEQKQLTDNVQNSEYCIQLPIL